jgi:hypothetical protein
MEKVSHWLAKVREKTPAVSVREMDSGEPFRSVSSSRRTRKKPEVEAGAREATSW